MAPLLLLGSLVGWSVVHGAVASDFHSKPRRALILASIGILLTVAFTVSLAHAWSR